MQATNRQWTARLGGALSLVLALSAWADVKVPPVFSNHMVLQRDQPVPVWGSAKPGEKVTVKFRTQEKTATADADGKWQVKLEPLSASKEPEQFVVSGANTLTFSNVLVGEVWVGSGQSNMQTIVPSYTAKDLVLAENAKQSYPQLRLLSSGSQWVEAKPETISRFSALGFSFALTLQKALGVPVGIMVGAVGGTPSGEWLPPEALAADEACQRAIKKYAAGYDFAAAVKQYHEKTLPAFEKQLAEYKAKLAEAKAKSEQEGADFAKKNREPRKPDVPVQAGETTRGKVGDLYARFILPLQPYAIRGVLWDQGESGTALNGVDQYTLMGGLIRGWRTAWGQGEFPFLYVQKPSGLGCAWDYENPVTSFANKFAPLPGSVPGEGGGLETHVKIMNYPSTFMVISSDLGPDVHPACKSGYGARSALVALGAVYGQKVEYYGPVYAKHQVEGGKVRVSFTHLGQGLAFKNGDKLQGFALAGADKKFVWAEARIDGDTVVLSSDAVKEPVAVRYAWAGNRQWANLFNKDGLPAISFRTDNW